jgi:hypothetical protein
MAQAKSYKDEPHRYDELGVLLVLELHKALTQHLGDVYTNYKP